MLPSVRLRLSQRLRPMLVFCTEDMDMAVMAMLVLVTMARGLLMLSQRLMLVCTMEGTDMVLVLDMLDMVTVLDMAVGSTTVKQLIYASKSSKVILLFSALYWGRNFVFMFRLINNNLKK